MTTVEERLSRLEGGYEHLAAKADVVEVKTEVAERIAGVKTAVSDQIAGVRRPILPQWRRGSSKWFTALLMGTALGVVTANVALTKLLGWALAAMPRNFRGRPRITVEWSLPPSPGAPPNGFPAKGRHQ